MDQKVISRLQGIVGKDNCFTHKEKLINYEYDSIIPRFRPDVVVFARTTEQVSQIMKLAHQYNIPVTPQGAGTNFSGGSMAVKGGILLSLAKMTRILEIDLENMATLVEPGVVNLELNNAIAGTGYFFPPDPASGRASTLGGNVAECAGGPRCLKYGVTRDYVLGLEVVLPNGEVTWVGGKHGNDRNLDLVRLMVGSEGTLGIFTKIWFRILPATPSKRTMLGIFNSVGEASQTVSDIIAAGVVPLTLEFMDNILINCAEDFAKAGLPRDAAAIIIIEVDGFGPELDKQVKIIEDAVNKNKAKGFRIAEKAEEVEKIWVARKVVIGALSRRRPSYSLQDVTVPRSNFPKICERIQQISEKYGLEIGILAHAGDGNLHPLVLFDERNEEEVEKVEPLEGEICQAAIDLNGNISGEHGIGYIKLPFVDWRFPQHTIDLYGRLKKAVDPDNVLNPGKIVEVK